MLKSESPAPHVIVVQPQRSIVGWLMTAAAVVAILIGAFVGYKAWHGFTLAEGPPGFSAVGPTINQLERLQYLVSSRVHVADVLVGESRWLKGSWIVQGDALIGVDMSRAEIKCKDGAKREAVIVLPAPTVMSPRVNHEKTQEWDVKSTSWIPLASWAFGDKKNM